MKINSVIAIAALLGLAASLCHVSAQTVSPTLTAELQAVESTPPLPATDAPMIGTFYSAKNPYFPPLPGNIFGRPIWDLGGGFYLLDDLNMADSSSSKASGMQPMDDEGPPSPGNGSGGTNNWIFFSIPTNGLWLEITNVADGLAYVNLRNATDYVYEIWSKTDLTASNWDIETEVFPGENTNTMPFTVTQSERTNLFIWARDWTGITSNGNTVPDWWLYFYYGDFGLTLSDTNLDGSGNDTLEDDYSFGYNPNIIEFSIEVTNNYVNNMSVPAQLNVSGGIPFYVAVLVDDTNFDDATWNTYTSSNITVNLGLDAGWHDVWIGLRGLPSDATPTWQWKHLNLTLPPVLAITNPAANVVDEPIIQIYGYCQESGRASATI
ncbi:MAG: hypothetical protein ACREFE_05195 [Limisphaerales bacterium]